MWCVAELELEYHRIDAGFTYGLVDSDPYLKMNPNGTIPTIRDGEQSPVWESGAIIRYLAAAYGGEQFWPSEAGSRAVVDQWAEWAKINVAGKFTAPIFWQVVRIPEARRDQSLIDDGLDTLNQSLCIADQQLASHRFLAGEHFSVADIQFGHCLFRYFDIDIARLHLPNLDRYYKLLSSRVAFQEHVQIDYSELIGSL